MPNEVYVTDEINNIFHSILLIYDRTYTYQYIEVELKLPQFFQFFFLNNNIYILIQISLFVSNGSTESKV